MIRVKTERGKAVKREYKYYFPTYITIMVLVFIGLFIYFNHQTIDDLWHGNDSIQDRTAEYDPLKSDAEIWAVLSKTNLRLRDSEMAISAVTEIVAGLNQQIHLLEVKMAAIGSVSSGSKTVQGAAGYFTPSK